MTDEGVDGDEGSTGGDDADVDWWAANERLRAEIGLPRYEPPRFSDGTYVQSTVSELEAEFGCTIRLAGTNTSAGEDWEVRVDGESIASIGRERTKEGTTVYGMTAERFRAIVAAQF